MNAKTRLGAAMLVALLLPACATVTRGTEQRFHINSQPNGAHVVLSSGMTCTTPCTLKLKRKRGFTAEFTLDGYQPFTATVGSHMSGGGGAGLAGNILIGGLIGIGVDASNGSLKDLTPNPLQVTLIRIEQVAAAAAGSSAGVVPTPATSPAPDVVTPVSPPAADIPADAAGSVTPTAAHQP